MGRVTQAAKRALMPLLAPAVTRYRAAHAQLTGIEQRSQVINDQVSVLLQRLVELEGALRIDASVLGEFSSVSRRIVSNLERRLDELADLPHGAIDRRRPSASGVIEVPAAVAALAGIEPPASLLVLGHETTDAVLSFASMGYPVTVLADEAPAHPLATAIATSAEQWDSPTERFAAAIVQLEPDATLEFMAPTLTRVRDWVEPGGRLVLTIGPHVGTPSSRGIDDEKLAVLLAEWQVANKRVYIEVEDRSWMLASGTDDDAAAVSRALVLVVATRP
jgi:hypothetical protein